METNPEKATNEVATKSSVVPMKRVKNSNNAVILISTESILNRLVEAETGMEMSTSYMTIEDWYQHKDKPMRVFFMGLETAVNEKGEQYQNASFIGHDKVFIAAQRVLVEAVRMLPKGQGVSITYLGSKPNKTVEGRTQLFSVVALNVNWFDLNQTAVNEDAEVING